MRSVELPHPVTLGVRLVGRLILGDQDAPRARDGGDQPVEEAQVKAVPAYYVADGVELQHMCVSEMSVDFGQGVPRIATLGGGDALAVESGRPEYAAAVRSNEPHSVMLRRPAGLHDREPVSSLRTPKSTCYRHRRSR